MHCTSVIRNQNWRRIADDVNAIWDVFVKDRCRCVGCVHLSLSHAEGLAQALKLLLWQGQLATEPLNLIKQIAISLARLLLHEKNMILCWPKPALHQVMAMHFWVFCLVSCECTSSCIMFLALSCPKYSAFPRIRETSYPQVSPSCRSMKMFCHGRLWTYYDSLVTLDCHVKLFLFRCHVTIV